MTEAEHMDEVVAAILRLTQDSTIAPIRRISLITGIRTVLDVQSRQLGRMWAEGVKETNGTETIAGSND